MACMGTLAEIEPLAYQSSLTLLTLSAPASVHTRLLALAADNNQLTPTAYALAPPSTSVLRHRLCVYRL
jgi:hypothetical protein